MNIELRNDLLSGSDDKVLKIVKQLSQFEPQYNKFLNDNVIQNIYSDYEALIKKGYPLINADNLGSNPPESIHFPQQVWSTINRLSEVSGLPKAFILYYSQAVNYLVKTGKIPISIIDPAKKKESEVLKEFIKIGKGAKWMIPLLIGVLGIGALAILKE